VLVASHISVAVAGRVLVADRSFELADGQRMVVQGPSGSGKTRLLRALAGLDPLSEGSLTLDGRSPDAHGLPAWRAQVTYVAQDPPPLSSTGRDWVGHVHAFAVHQERPVDDPIALAEAWLVPPDRWDQPWPLLSGGERQRIHLATALSLRPRILLLDEPTASLDPTTVQAVEATLRQRTCILVTHDPAQADRLADIHLRLP
jgi:ABC-type iron transport system FetAB ATPase subunit